MQITHRNYRPGRYISRAATREFADVAVICQPISPVSALFAKIRFSPASALFAESLFSPAHPPQKLTRRCKAKLFVHPIIIPF